MRASLSFGLLLIVAGIGGAGPVTGRIENPQTAADLITYNQNNHIGLSIPVEGRIERATGVISRWELPIPVFADPSVSRANVSEAVAYWQSVTALPFVLLDRTRAAHWAGRAAIEPGERPACLSHVPTTGRNAGW